jgi:hypothetical protein
LLYPHNVKTLLAENPASRQVPQTP